jgi:hypothetical protein
MAAVVIVAEVVRLGPTSAGCPTTVTAIAVPSRFSLGIRDKREGLQERA